MGKTPHPKTLNLSDKPPKTYLFYPKLFSLLKFYSFSHFLNDLTAGTIVGIVALPLAIAFAIASGVTPEHGLITAIVAGFLISALGGSRVQIGGPTGAFVVIVAGIVERYGLNGLLLATSMAGILLIGMGVLRLGVIIKFIPYPLTVGFTSGIAVVILSSQIKDFFGLNTGPLPADFFEKWRLYLKSFHTFDPTTLLISLSALALILLWPKIPGALTKKIPGSIIAILTITPLVHFLHLPVETIGSRFGAIPSGLPALTLPHFSFYELKNLIGPAFTIALLGAIESLLSATVADGMIESRHRSNTELIAQGIANLFTPLFGGIPATGAIARTATNVKNGAKTPVSGMIHALTLLVIVLLFGRLASLIPLAILASILMVVCYHMSEWRSFKALLKGPRMDVAVLVSTFLLTVFIDLTVAVEIGMLLSMTLFMKRMTDVTTIREITHEMEENFGEEDAFGREKLPQGVVVYEAEGAFFFGVAESLRETLQWGAMPPRVLILRMRHVLAMDASGIRALRDLKKGCQKTGTHLILEGIHSQPLFALERAHLLSEIGKEHFFESMDLALQKAQELCLNPTSLRT